VKLIPSIPITQHRLKRLAAQAVLLLAWMAHALIAAACTLKPRHIRQRHGFSVDHLARSVQAMLIVRAVQMLKTPLRAGRVVRLQARAGFTRRSAPCGNFRPLLGSALRKHLYARHPLVRIARLIAALRDMDKLAARLTKRFKRRLTRLCPIVPVRPPHDAQPLCVVPTICVVDSS
jgi:hypothetical protein